MQDNAKQPKRWLCHAADNRVFAYARGHEFYRFTDDALWAHRADDGSLRSARSGDCIVYRIGDAYYDPATHLPVYFLRA